ncbi:hypothetical protein KC319_g15357, partial [Hortaea werneckii]
MFAPSSRSLLSSFTTRTCCLRTALQDLSLSHPRASIVSTQPSTRSFHTTPRTQDWLSPKAGESSKSRKGR